MKHFCVFFLAGAVLFSAAHGQTYLTKAVRFEGVDSYQKADLLKVAGLRDNGAFTKQELDAAVQKLADTGLFAGTAYKIDATALVITLAPVEPAQLLSVDYANFVWWKPEELTPLVHTRVALFDGKVPKNGSLVDDVRDALVAMLKEKGVDAKVEQMVGGTSAQKLIITRPEIKIGDVRFEGVGSATAAEQDKVKARFTGEDFEEQSTRKGLVDLTTQMFHDDGYLDVAVEPLPHSEPRAAGVARYEVDLTAKVQGGEIYRVSSVEVEAAAPISKSDLLKEVGVKPGDVAGAYMLNSTLLRLEGPYKKRGYLGADAKVKLNKDAANHRVAYALSVEPGEVYHVIAVRSEGLTPEQQAEVEKSLHVEPTTVADAEFLRRLSELPSKKAFSGMKPGVGMQLNKQNHTVVYVLRPTRGRSGN